MSSSRDSKGGNSHPKTLEKKRNLNIFSRSKPDEELQKALEVERRRADDQQSRAESLQDVAERIKQAVIQIAEKWGQEEPKFFNDVSRYCQKGSRMPEAFYHLVRVLIAYYEVRQIALHIHIDLEVEFSTYLSGAEPRIQFIGFYHTLHVIT